MKILNALIATLGLLFLFVGCAQQQTPTYNWHNYSTASVTYGKNIGSKEYTQAYIDELNKIINDSTHSSGRVPPGIYPELGQILYTQGKKEEAKGYFIKETELYPESKVFISRVMEKLYGKKD
jgi:hypothetical protein